MSFQSALLLIPPAPRFLPEQRPLTIAGLERSRAPPPGVSDAFPSLTA